VKKAIRHPFIAAKFPHFLHGGDYNPDQWLKWKDTIWKEDMRLAKLAGVNTLSIGIFAWAALEPSEGEFRFDWLDEVMDILAENGMAAVLATPSGSRPAWMSQKYPEVLRVNEYRQKNLYGERHNHCMSSPVYREKTAAVNTRLAERYKEHPALAVWHISNEYSGECHCPLCQENFRIYLKKRFGDLDALNEAWWNSFWSHTYTEWSQVESPSPLGQVNVHGLNLEWKRFCTEQIVDFYLHETAPLKRITPNVPCTTNLMSGASGVDNFRLARALDVDSWDSYPEWTGTEKDIEIGTQFSFYHDMNRSAKGKPFMMIESCPSATNWRPVAKLHRPGVHMLQAMQAVAHGADTVQYFQFRKSRGSSEKFHGAIVDHEGSENTRVFGDVAEVGKRLAGMDAVVGTSTPAAAALIYDYHNHWILDDIKGLQRGNNKYKETVISHYHSFWRMGVSVDVLDSVGNFDGYDLVAAPMLYMLRSGFAEKISAFVQAGGTFVATYATGYADENDLCFLGGFPGPLKEVLGIWCEEIDALYPEDRNSFNWNDKEYPVFDFCELVHLRGADCLAVFNRDFYRNRPVITMNRYGKGKAFFLAARTEQPFLNDFYAWLVKETNIPRTLDSELPEGVTAQMRSDGNTDYIFLMNFSPSEQIVETNNGRITLAPWGVHIEEKRNNKGFYV
jgi:beta-galactosidase